MDDLSVNSIVDGLSTKFLGKPVFYYASIASTQPEAQHMARLGATEGTMVIADVQTAGRGRFDREWITQPGSGLAFSLVLRPYAWELPQINMAVSLAIVKGVEASAGLEPTIKWPNDILIRGKKVCGILIDSETEGASLAHVIVGIGINVNFDPSIHPEIANIATSLSKELGREVSRVKVLQAILKEMERLYGEIRLGSEAVYQDWKARLETLGKHIRVRSGERVEVGWAEDVDPDGCLLLRRDDGTLLVVPAGEVTLRA
ncbi:MAG: biotin--[acetyl-CoA-carboxylase] ligase [Chloroflexi bacterium]|nr:biotin--[acetyl-CoA-carboxylase] ligase [Chloroflexota bacterium]